MTTRNILCAYNGGETALGSLRYAIRIAKHHDGWLTGVVRHGRPELEARFGQRLPNEVIDAMHTNDNAWITAVAEAFHQEAAASGMADRAEFLEIEDESELALGELARTFDLVVTSAPTRKKSGAHLAADPDMISLRSGRPVLVVPAEYHAEGLADHAILAWDGKRSAARALGDAMPVLEEKAKVTVLCIGKTPPEGTDRLITNLERHGIHPTLEVRPRNHSVARTILDVVKELKAQLIVMGAYEHSKFSHDLFGGVTTDLVAGAQVPVFMSH